jgi:serine/threonine protein kinase
MLSMSVDGKLKSSVFSHVGTNIEWAAPEVIAQHHKYDEKSDMYSFGMLALELLFGKTPFEGWPALKVLLCKMNFPCPGIEKMDEKNVSESMWRMIKLCIQKDPRKRFRSR